MKKQGTLLIVDDNRNILTTVRMLLEPIFSQIIRLRGKYPWMETYPPSQIS